MGPYPYMGDMPFKEMGHSSPASALSLDSDTMHLVEIRRGKGDILEYYKLFNELVTKQIAHLIRLPPSLG